MSRVLEAVDRRDVCSVGTDRVDLETEGTLRLFVPIRQSVDEPFPTRLQIEHGEFGTVLPGGRIAFEQESARWRPRAFWPAAAIRGSDDLSAAVQGGRNTTREVRRVIESNTS